MRPFGNKYSEEQITKDKKNDFEPYLKVYDNRRLSTALRKGTLKTNDAVLMTGFTENVRPFVGDLSNENNFLRLVQTEHLNLKIDTLLDVAYKTRLCVKLFIFNYSHKIKPNNGQRQFQLPLDYRESRVLTCNYSHQEH